MIAMVCARGTNMAAVDASFAKLDKERLIELSFLPDGARTFRGDKNGLLLFLNALRKEGESGFCDVNLEVEGQVFAAHRCVLAANSQFFYTMFTSGMRDSNDSRIKLCSLTSGALSSILDFFYTREINISRDNVVDILEAASFLLLTPVKSACAQIILSALRINNCISTRRVADKYALEELKIKADSFIKKNFQQVRSEEEFLDLSIGELCELISSDDLNVETEEEVFEAVLKWVKHESQNRAMHLPTALPCLRFGSLSSDFVERQIEGESLLQQCTFCQNFIKMYQRRQRATRAKKGGMSQEERPSAKVHNVMVGVGRGNLRTSFCYDTDSDTMYQLSEPYSPSFVLGVAVLGREVYCVCRNRHNWDIGASMLLRYPLDQSNKSFFSWTDMASCDQLATACNDQTNLVAMEGQLYIVGGCNGGASGRVQCYNPGNNVWTTVASCLTPRCQVGAVAFNSHLYIIGGTTEHLSQPVNLVERYNPAADSWTLVCPMKSKRRAPQVIATSTSIFAVGGATQPGHDTVTCEVYKPAFDQWIIIAPLPQGKDTPKLVNVLRDEVYTVRRSNIWKYEVKKNAWKKSSKLKSLRSGFDDFHLTNLQLPKFCFQHRSKSNSRILANYDRSIYDCTSDEEDDEDSLMDYGPPWFLWGDDSSGSDW
ncbi:kelch-like protein 3 [Nematostella vectensis]|uniref:kelch-like protein 3 n=1 Tax=Nematostella vectensis TaxID=45351 RepID=UPI0020775850|nr:kelch-like protein 3 [Nematostella vectensis]